jgi:hypothetical protein
MCVRETAPSITLAMYRFTTAGAIDVSYSSDGKTNLVLPGALGADVRMYFDETAKPWAATSITDSRSVTVYTLAANGAPDPAWSGDGIARVPLPFDVDLAGIARSDNRLFVTTFRGTASIGFVALKA